MPFLIISYHFHVISTLEKLLAGTQLTEEQAKFFNDEYLSIIENAMLTNDSYHELAHKDKWIIQLHKSLLRNLEILEKNITDYNTQAKNKLISPLQKCGEKDSEPLGRNMNH